MSLFYCSISTSTTNIYLVIIAVFNLVVFIDHDNQKAIRKWFNVKDWLLRMVLISVFPVVVSAMITLKTKSYLSCELWISDKYYDDAKMNLKSTLLHDYESLFGWIILLTICKYLKY